MWNGTRRPIGVSRVLGCPGGGRMFNVSTSLILLFTQQSCIMLRHWSSVRDDTTQGVDRAAGYQVIFFVVAKFFAVFIFMLQILIFVVTFL